MSKLFAGVILTVVGLVGIGLDVQDSGWVLAIGLFVVFCEV